MKQYIQKLSRILFETGLFFAQYRKAVDVLKPSVLNQSGNNPQTCPLCREKNLKPLIDMPIGWPMVQNDHLLYFDLKNDHGTILKYRSFIEKTAGFMLNLPWVFCDGCKNAFLNVSLPESQLELYYSKFYQRLAISNEKRKNTKEVHARYIDGLISRQSNILEIGSAEGYAASYLRRCGHRVWENELSNGKGDRHLEDAGFDCIFLHHVFEHFEKPISFLQHSYRALKPNGLLIIQVPDLSLQMGLYLKSFRWCHYRLWNFLRVNEGLIEQSEIFCKKFQTYKWMDALSNNHLFAFTPNGLTSLLERADFQIQVVQQTTQDRLMFKPEEYSWPVDRENGQTPNGLTVVATKD